MKLINKILSESDDFFKPRKVQERQDAAAKERLLAIDVYKKNNTHLSFKGIKNPVNNYIAELSEYATRQHNEGKLQNYSAIVRKGYEFKLVFPSVEELKVFEKVASEMAQNYNVKIWRQIYKQNGKGDWFIDLLNCIRKPLTESDDFFKPRGLDRNVKRDQEIAKRADELVKKYPGAKKIYLPETLYCITMTLGAYNSIKDKLGEITKKYNIKIIGNDISTGYQEYKQIDVFFFAENQFQYVEFYSYIRNRVTKDSDMLYFSPVADQGDILVWTKDNEIFTCEHGGEIYEAMKLEWFKENLLESDNFFKPRKLEGREEERNNYIKGLIKGLKLRYPKGKVFKITDNVYELCIGGAGAHIEKINRTTLKKIKELENENVIKTLARHTYTYKQSFSGTEGISDSILFTSPLSHNELLATTEKELSKAGGQQIYIFSAIEKEDIVFASGQNVFSMNDEGESVDIGIWKDKWFPEVKDLSESKHLTTHFKNVKERVNKNTYQNAIDYSKVNKEPLKEAMTVNSKGGFQEDDKNINKFIKHFKELFEEAFPGSGIEDLDWKSSVKTIGDGSRYFEQSFLYENQEELDKLEAVSGEIDNIAEVYNVSFSYLIKKLENRVFLRFEF